MYGIFTVSHLHSLLHNLYRTGNVINTIYSFNDYKSTYGSATGPDTAFFGTGHPNNESDDEDSGDYKDWKNNLVITVTQRNVNCQ